MQKIFWSLALSLALATVAWAQPELGECDKPIKELAQKNLDKALKFWKAKDKQQTRYYLERAISADENCAHALYLLGELFFISGNLQGAEAQWVKTQAVCPDYKPELDFFIGIIQLEGGKNKLAAERLQKFLKNPERDRTFDAEARNALEAATIVEQLTSNPVPFDPKPLRKICTPEDEYLGCISPDGEWAFFTRRSKKVNKYDGVGAAPRLVEEFSSARLQSNGQFDAGAALERPFNQNLNEGGPSITADNSELYFTVCQKVGGKQNCDIWYSERNGEFWTAPVALPQGINLPDSWESQPSVSANGDVLLFVSNRAGGQGGIDIYKSVRQPDGSWGAPENLGKEINTTKDDKSPFLHSDSQTLYFSSQGHAGMGGFDIFFTRAKEDGSWEKPQNIGYPINNTKDDLGLFVNLEGTKAYFASNNHGGVGGWDLFEFDLPAQVKPAEVVLVRGTLEGDMDLKGTAVVVSGVDSKQSTVIQVRKESGTYAGVVKVKKAEDLIVTVQKEGAAFSSNYIARQELVGKKVEAPLEVQKLETNREYRFNDIFFETNSYELNEGSRAVCDAFILFLSENPTLKVDIQGHTDNVGLPAANLALSQNRAKAVYNYLLQRGVQANRLTHHGFGETKPVSDNASEWGRSRNRRTIFVITAR
jgi:outer membrane protein OmpA-like peptidoglycan-associated protein